MEILHSIIITFQDKAVVWYPDKSYIAWYFIREDGVFEPTPFKQDYNSMTATRFIEHYAEGTD